MSENCRRCGKPMIIMKWNSNVDVITCNTTGCELYRRPTPITKGTTSLAEELGGVYSKHKRRPKEREGRKYAAFTFEERLQELRKEVSA